ncbi:MAG: succinate dehydrogenase / fumarate reductase cytochrome b subunit [Acidimicrobiales bacterium]
MAAPTTSSRKAARSADAPLRKKSKELPFPLNLYQTAVGKKWVMALTGIMILGFVLFHMLGNLKLYIGQVEHLNPEGEFVSDYDINIYGEFLRDLAVPLFPRTYLLWLLRFGLIGAFALHIHSAYSLTRMNQTANVAYASKRDFVAANFASRTMRVSGVIVLFYLIFHLADLTWGLTSDEWVRGHVYENMVHSLSRWWVALIYIACNILLSVHIFHGAWSMFQTLGINNPRYNSLRKGFAAGFAGLILLGNISFPIAILSGVVDL